jgi:hypothetical protein
MMPLVTTKMYLVLQICSVAFPWNCEVKNIRMFTANNQMQCYMGAPSVTAEATGNIDIRDRRIFRMECKDLRRATND